MTPAVSQNVHYVSHGTPAGKDGTQAYKSKCRAAIITEVPGAAAGSVSLAVLNPTGAFFNENVPYDPGRDWAVPGGTPEPELCTGLEHDGGTWHWPARAGT